MLRRTILSLLVKSLIFISKKITILLDSRRLIRDLILINRKTQVHKFLNSRLVQLLISNNHQTIILSKLILNGYRMHNRLIEIPQRTTMSLQETTSKSNSLLTIQEQKWIKTASLHLVFQIQRLRIKAEKEHITSMIIQNLPLLITLLLGNNKIIIFSMKSRSLNSSRQNQL